MPTRYSPKLEVGYGMQELSQKSNAMPAELSNEQMQNLLH
jgi:hypothetical protein